MALENNLSCLPLPARCAVEWLGTVREQERTKARLGSLLDHFLTASGLSQYEGRNELLESAWAIAQRRYLIEVQP